MTDIFLSYSSKDRERVRALRDALAGLGYDVFWDVETPAGENWDAWIRDHIARAKVVIILWTKNSAASPNVQHEAAIARDANKLLAAQLEAMKAIDFPMGFYTTQAPLLAGWNGAGAHEGYSSLLKAIRTRCEGNADASAATARKEDDAELAALQRKAKSGDPVAQVQLGYRYSTGQGVAVNKHEAARLYRLSADQGHAGAQCNLGVLYEQGLGGLPKDGREAVRLYKLAADKGDAGAQANLGLMYEDGRGGIAPNEYAAAVLYRLAADQGDAAGQAYLAEMYEHGKGGLPMQLNEAIRLYRLSANKGRTQAINALKRLGKWP
jgi:TIR domain/Sel1 repeat